MDNKKLNELADKNKYALRLGAIATAVSVPYSIATGDYTNLAAIPIAAGVGHRFDVEREVFKTLKKEYPKLYKEL